MEVREDTVASRVQDLYNKFKPAPAASTTLSVITQNVQTLASLNHANLSSSSLLPYGS